MVKAVDVRPRKWSNTVVLFDNGYYSAIWGNYSDETRKNLGIRWNGDSDNIGFPSTRGKPQWYVEPDEKYIGTFHDLLLWLNKCKLENTISPETYIKQHNAILNAMSEFLVTKAGRGESL